jgi:virginiamycin A acetyltransferase
MGPNPLNPHPMQGFPRVCYLKPVITRANIEVGDFTYYDDPDAPERFEDKCVLYHYDFMGDRLVIGRFCALATGVTFIMNGANHVTGGFSTYPFEIFGQGWEQGFDMAAALAQSKGDTVVGHDVWLGRQALVMPGVKIGSGSIVASSSVVVSDIPPFAVVGGNPARVIRMRFDEKTVAALLEIAWWDWDAEKIGRNRHAIRGADLAALRAAT